MRWCCTASAPCPSLYAALVSHRGPAQHHLPMLDCPPEGPPPPRVQVRVVLVERLLGGRRLNPLEALLYIGPPTFLMLGAGSWVFEWGQGLSTQASPQPHGLLARRHEMRCGLWGLFQCPSPVLWDRHGPVPTPSPPPQSPPPPAPLPA